MAGTNTVVSPITARRERILSIDATRGIDLVLGLAVGQTILPALHSLGDNPVTDVLTDQLTHSQWHGFTLNDLGYPMYVITMCASMVFSYHHRRAKGQSNRDYLAHVLIRSTVIYVFAIFLYGGFSTTLEDVEVGHVFHQLAYCNLFAGIILLTTSHRERVIILITFLFAWWAILALIPVPQFGTGDFSSQGNVLHYALSFCPNAFVEFLVRTPRMFGTCLFGLLVGDWLLCNRTEVQKTIGLIAFSIAAINVGVIWDSWLPINKLLWTSSYTLLTAGGTCAFIGVFHLLITVLDFKAWAVPLIAVGRSPLAAWGGYYLLPFEDIANRIAGNAFAPYLGEYHQLILATVQVSLWWLFMYWLFRRNLILKL